MSRTDLRTKKYHQRDRDSGHMTDFEILRPFPISKMVEATDLKFGMWME